MPKLHIVCLRPGGMNRGGARHEGRKAHEMDAFTPEQLREMLAEPALELVIGDALTEADIAKLEAKDKKAAKPD